MLEFRTLGSIDLRGDDGRRVESVLLHSKRLSLLTYLCACQPSQLHRRDTLVALFWPELDDTHARNALRQELFGLRRALGKGAFVVDRGEAIGVEPQRVWCDVRAFEDALAGGRLAEALELWQGEFAPGLHVDGGEFERWLDEERDRLGRKAIDAARRLVAEAEAAGDLPRAVACARRLTELAPYDETGWQSLISLLDRSGDRAGALAAYNTLTARLRAELEIEPSPETRALIERVRQRDETFATTTVIAILPVDNQTGDARLDAAGRQLTDRLARGIAGPQFAHVALGDRGSKATVLVSAAMYPRGELVEVGVRILEPGEGGRIVAVAEPVQFRPDAGIEPLDRLVAHVVVLVAFHYDRRVVAPGRGGVARIPSLESYMEYLRGADSFGEYRFDESAQHLRRAYELDPCHVRAAIFASVALLFAGRPAEADSLTSSALAAGEPLPEYERCFGRWLLATLHGQRAEAYRAAVEMLSFTQHFVFRTIAAHEALWMNLPREALRIRPEPPDAGVGFWNKVTSYWHLVGSAYHLQNDHEHELAEVLRGRVSFSESFDVILAEIRARAGLHQAGEVLKLVAEALTLAPQGAGFPNVPTTPGDISWAAASELDAHGRADAGARARALGLRWLAGRSTATRADRLLEARLLLESGDAEAAYRILITQAPFNDLESAGLAGLIAAGRGDVGTARDMLAHLEALQNPYVSGRPLLAAAGIRAALNEADTAVETLRAAFAAGLRFSVEFHALPMLQPLATREDFVELLEPRGLGPVTLPDEAHAPVLKLV